MAPYMEESPLWTGFIYFSMDLEQQGFVCAVCRKVFSNITEFQEDIQSHDVEDSRISIPVKPHWLRSSKDENRDESWLEIDIPVKEFNQHVHNQIAKLESLLTVNHVKIEVEDYEVGGEHVDQLAETDVDHTGLTQGFPSDGAEIGRTEQGLNLLRADEMSDDVDNQSQSIHSEPRELAEQTDEEWLRPSRSAKKSPGTRRRQKRGRLQEPSPMLSVGKRMKASGSEEAESQTSLQCDSHQCSWCDQTFRYKSSLKQHWLNHEDGSMYRCCVCEELFPNSSDLETHQNAAHSDTIYPSTECDETYKTKHGLSHHAKSHRDASNFQCEYCERTFLSKGDYEGHVSGHTAIRPYQCLTCGMAFSYKSNLTSHAEICGLLEKPHKCTICSKAFRAKRYLHVHVQSHTREKKLLCVHCGKCYSHRGSLTSHIHVKHRDKVAKGSRVSQTSESS